MYNLYPALGAASDLVSLFGGKYEITDDIAQANVIVTDKSTITEEMLKSRLVFAVADFSADGLDDETVGICSECGICVFRCEEPALTAVHINDFIENGNIRGSINFPYVNLGPFGDDVSRISILMKGIDAPILLGAMITSEMDLRAIAGGLKDGYGTALIAGREPVTRLPHADGVIKVRVLQDI